LKVSVRVVQLFNHAGTITGKLLKSLSFLIVMMLVTVSLQAHSAELAFDHISTGFPLTGMHARVSCESCHMDGIFRGTPRECRSCHARGSRFSATVPPEDMVHNLNQLTECDQCHRAAGWTVAHFEHLGITSGCNLCHVSGGDGRAPPNDEIHAKIMGADCSECHHSTQSFTSATLLDHSNFTSGCGASGCHAVDKARARNHGQLSECQYCHRYPNWAVSTMNHDYIGGTQCRSCHMSGSLALATTVVPTDQFHARVNQQDCSDCHSTTTFTGAKYDHNSIVTGCAVSGCHAEDQMQAKTHAGLNSCESCHYLYPKAWSPIRAMDHSAIGPTMCESCHTPGGLSTFSTQSIPNHPSTNGQSCSACHSTVTFTL